MSGPDTSICELPGCTRRLKSCEGPYCKEHKNCDSKFGYYNKPKRLIKRMTDSLNEGDRMKKAITVAKMLPTIKVTKSGKITKVKL